MQSPARLVRRPRLAVGARVMGIDPSLTSSAWACRKDGELRRGIIDPRDARGPRRLLYARDQLAAILDEFQPTHIVYEDYAMGKAKGGQGRIFDIGELGGVFKTLIYERGITMLLVSPTSLKKFVMGKGVVTIPGVKKPTTKQKKEPVVKALAQYFGMHVPQYDEADATGLMLFGEIRTGLAKPPQDGLLSLRLNAVASCTEVPGKLQSISNKRT